MASKYDRLADYLHRQAGPSHTMSFALIERVIGESLPTSVRRHRPWWSNERSPDGRHVQAKHGWLAAGWEVDAAELDRETVTFRRSRTD
jgi:hypothetical protein